MPPGVVTRVYNISDLIQPTMSYPFQTIVIPPVQLGARQQQQDSQSPFGAAGQPTAPSSPVSAEGITKVIQEVVAPETWRDNGGSDGSLRMIDRLLVVTQTPERQQKVTELLEQLRHESGPGRTITVKADWILLNADQLQRVTARSSSTFSPGASGLVRRTRKPSRSGTRPRSSRFSARSSCRSGSFSGSSAPSRSSSAASASRTS